MWADNETTIDLLGFDYLVDSLEVVLTEPRLLPVTVGVLGDWGSGKTSLLSMVVRAWAPPKGYVVVPFSPWRYEAYEDVKAALMDAVLTEVAKLVPPTTQSRTASSTGSGSRSPGSWRGRPPRERCLPPRSERVAAAHMGCHPSLARLQDRRSLPERTRSPRERPRRDDGVNPTSRLCSSPSRTSATSSRLWFESLDDVKAVVVLIDDLDRCLDDTVDRCVRGDPPLPAGVEDGLRHRCEPRDRPGCRRAPLPGRPRRRRRSRARTTWRRSSRSRSQCRRWPRPRPRPTSTFSSPISDSTTRTWDAFGGGRRAAPPRPVRGRHELRDREGRPRDRRPGAAGGLHHRQPDRPDPQPRLARQPPPAQAVPQHAASPTRDGERRSVQLDAAILAKLMVLEQAETNSSNSSSGK